MKEKATKTYRLEPRDYKRILDKVHLESIGLDSCSSKVNHDNLDRDLRIIVDDSISHQLLDEDKVNFSHKYTLVATKKSKRDFALKISCTFSVRFSSEEPLSNEFLDIFSDVNIPVNTWPYFREFIQSMAQRMCLPPIMLPLLKRG